MAAVTRLGLHGGPRGLYGDFSGKAAAAVQMSGTTGFQWAPTGALDVEATLAGSTGFAWSPTGALDQEATLSGSTGFTWTPSGNLVDINAVVAKKAGDLISEISVAMVNGVGLKGIAGTIHPYPTQADALRKVGLLYNKTRLTPGVKKWMERWMAFRR